MRPLRVLFVDNDATQAIGFIEQLRDGNMTVTPVELVEQALECIEENNFDAVILDLIIPRGPLPEDETAGVTKTGLALARRVRRKRQTTPILFLTVVRDNETLAWCNQNPPASYLLKSELKYGDLSSEIRRLLSRSETEALEFVNLVASRFKYVAARLHHRHDQRATLTVVDEYDVQDLFGALLALQFDDIRREEWNPSYAGGGSRGDLLIREHGILIEVKMPRKSQSDRLMGEQLIIDIARYRAHPDCQLLFCFIYDPAGVLRNPGGLAADVERLSGPDLSVVVQVSGPLEYNPVAPPGGWRRR